MCICVFIGRILSAPYRLAVNRLIEDDAPPVDIPPPLGLLDEPPEDEPPLERLEPPEDEPPLEQLEPPEDEPLLRLDELPEDFLADDDEEPVEFELVFGDVPGAWILLYPMKVILMMTMTMMRCCLPPQERHPPLFSFRCIHRVLLLPFRLFLSSYRWRFEAWCKTPLLSSNCGILLGSTMCGEYSSQDIKICTYRRIAL